MTHRQLVTAVRRRAAALGMTPYRLHARLGGRVSKQTVYNFVKHGAIIKSDTLALLMGVLGLTLTDKSGGAGRGGPPREARR